MSFNRSKETMCGISGIFTLKPKGDEGDIVKMMNQCLAHRGPDDEGVYIGKNMFMGMRRLSIIDLEGGHQPLFNEDKSLVLILNGEIYNYIELREGLIKKGHIFQTDSDAEVVLHLYEEKGIQALDDLNGMFAFCLWDEKKGEGFIVRDRLGIKPLYYWCDQRSIIFASELKALLNCLPHLGINKKAIIAYLQYMYIPAPMTPFLNVQKLLPASYIRFSLEGIDSPEYYWFIPMKEDKNILNDQLKSDFYKLMEDAISLQLRSDVPIGIFLSGGIDSSLVTAFAVRKMGANVFTFNVEYEGAIIKEMEYAQLIADIFNCNHHTVKVNTEDVIHLLPEIIWHMDEPIADSAVVGTYMVSEAASKYVKVVLNGTGGDELFAGYSTYLDSKQWQVKLLRLFPSIIFGFLSCINKNLFNNKFLSKIIYCNSRRDFFNLAHIQFISSEWNDFFADKKDFYNPDELLLKYYDNACSDDINKMLYTDLKFYMTDDLLLLLDKMTMANSIEGRVPILDQNLVEWAFEIDGKLKIHKNELKYLLKDWLKELLPERILFRSKMGFGAPVEYWMKNGLLEECIRIIDTRPESRDNFYWGLRGNSLRKKILSLNAQQCFALLALELWFRIYIDNADKNLSLDCI